jgi:hypothetical protein
MRSTLISGSQLSLSRELHEFDGESKAHAIGFAEHGFVGKLDRDLIGGLGLFTKQRV